jgi:hypothetical protein
MAWTPEEEASYDNALDLTYDEDGRVVGYSIGGTRGYGIEEWKRKKDDERFAKQAAVWRARKWQLANPERTREKRLEWWRKQPRDAKRAAVLVENERRRERYRADPLVFECAECGAVWCKAPWIRGPRPKSCGVRCQSRLRARARGHEPGPMRAPRKTAGPPRPTGVARVYRCGVCREPGHTKPTCPVRTRRAARYREVMARRARRGREPA